MPRDPRLPVDAPRALPYDGINNQCQPYTFTDCMKDCFGSTVPSIPAQSVAAAAGKSAAKSRMLKRFSITMLGRGGAKVTTKVAARAIPVVGTALVVTDGAAAAACALMCAQYSD